MLKKLLAAMFAATLMTGSVMGLDAPMVNVVGTGGTAVDKTTTDDKTAGTGTTDTILIGAASSITGETDDAGGTASYTVEDGFTLQGDTGKVLSVVGGDGTTANGGNATLLVGEGSTGILDLGAGTLNITAGGETGAFVGGSATVFVNAGATLKNGGTITVSAPGANGASASLVIGDGATYVGGGTINLAGTMNLGGTVTAAGAYTPGNVDNGITGLGALFADTALAATGVINVSVADTKNLGTDNLALKSAVAGGVVNIAGAFGSTVALTNNINVGAANLNLKGGTLLTMSGNITAKTITTSTGPVVFTGALTGDVVATSATTFSGSSAALNGSLDASSGTASVVIGGATAADAASITIADSKTLTNGAGLVTLTEGSALTLAAGSTYAGSGNNIATHANGSTVTVDASVTGFADAVGDTQLTATSTLQITNNGKAPVDFTTSGIAVGSAALGSTVKVDMNGKTLGNGTAALDAKAANIAVTGDSIFDGAVVTTSTAVDAVSIAAGKTATFTAGVATGGGIAQAAGSKGIYTGNIVGNVVLTGATLETAGAGATITGDLTTDAASTISIGENGGAPGSASTLGSSGSNAININPDTVLQVNSNVADGSTIFDTNFVNDAIATTSKTAVEDWLNANASSSLTSDNSFTIDGSGKVVYDKKAAAPTAGRLNNVLKQNGAGDFAPLVNNNLVNGLVNASDIVAGTPPAGFPTYAALSARDQNIVDVMDALAGNTNANFGNYTGRGNTAYAGYRWATGQDLANSVEAVTDTVRNFGKAVVNQAIRPNGANTAEFGSTGAYGAPLTMLDCNNYANRIWAGYTGMWGDADARGGDRGYEYDANGFNIGYDRAFASGFSFGAAFGYSKGDYDLKGGLGSDSDIDNYSFALYGSWKHCSGLFTTLLGSYTYSDYDMNNQFGPGLWDRADYHSDTWSVGGEVGYEFRPTQNFALVPTLGLYYYDSSTNRFNTSSGRLGMKYSNSSIEMPIEVTAKYDVCIGAETNLTLTATGGYTYNFRDKGTKIDRFVMGGTGIVMGGDRGRSAGHSGWNVGGGANMQYRNFDFGVNYEYNARSDYDSHNLWVNAGIRF